jgi:hypothetical protein
LAEVVLVDDRALLPNFLFIGTAATLQVRFPASLGDTLLNGVQKVVALATELHCDTLVIKIFPFVLEGGNVRSKRKWFQKVVEESITGCLANLVTSSTAAL